MKCLWNVNFLLFDNFLLHDNARVLLISKNRQNNARLVWKFWQGNDLGKSGHSGSCNEVSALHLLEPGFSVLDSTCRDLS